jgi:6-phosphogluconolactonase/glucosamine-6-phosphate isomerase/deaminase
MDNIMKTVIDGSEVVVLPGSSEISGFPVEFWKDLALSSIKERGLFSVALSGGNTPQDFYLRLAGDKEAASRLTVLPQK